MTMMNSALMHPGLMMHPGPGMMMQPGQGRAAEESYSSSADDEDRRRKAPRRGNDGALVAADGCSSAAAAANVDGSAASDGHGIVPDTFQANMLEARRTSISRSISHLRKIPTKYLSTGIEFMEAEFDSSLTTDLSHEGLLRLIWLMTKMKPSVSISGLRVGTYGSLIEKLATAHKRVLVNPVYKWKDVLTELGGGLDLFQDHVVTEIAVKHDFQEAWLSSEKTKGCKRKGKVTVERAMAIMDALRDHGVLPAAQPQAECHARAVDQANANVPKASPVQSPPAKAAIGHGIVPRANDVSQAQTQATGHGIVPKATAAKATTSARPPQQRHHAGATPVNPRGPPPPKAVAPAAPASTPKAGVESRRLTRNASTTTIVPYAAFSKSRATAAAPPAAAAATPARNNIIHEESERENEGDEYHPEDEDYASQHSHGLTDSEENAAHETQSADEAQSASGAEPQMSEFERPTCLFCMQNMDNKREAPRDPGRCCAGAVNIETFV